MAVFLAEMGDIDTRQRIRRFDNEFAAARHVTEFLASSENRERAFQPAQIVDLSRHGDAYQNFQNGFLASSWVAVC